MITALGAWALIVVNSVVTAVACAAGSFALAVAPVATVLCSAFLFARGAGGESSARSLPDSVDAVIGEIRGLLGGARRLGLNEIDAVLVARGPRIGVTVPARGRVVVRVHESVVRWIERHRSRGGASTITIGTFIRFAVLHELGHILNGDHRTYRFARSVLVAHLWWSLSLITLPLALAGGNASGARMIFSATVFMTLLLMAQSLIARRFIDERERLADWRAMQSLSMEDAARLLRRRGMPRGKCPAPTEIEKLMIDLKAEPSPAEGIPRFSRAIRVLWPETATIHQRAEALAGERAGAPARPVKWAALTGFQCGILATSVTMGLFLVAGRMHEQVAFWVVMIVMAWIAGPAGTHCVMRADPARMSIGDGVSTAKKISVGVAFFLTFTCGVAVTHQLAKSLGIATWISGLGLGVAIVVTMVLVTGCAYLAGLIHMFQGSVGGTFRVAPREPWVFAVPLVTAMVVVLGPVNMVVTSSFGLGSPLQGAWVAVMLCSLGAYTLSTVMARSPHASVRSLAPMGVFEARAPVFGFRLFWRELFLDITRWPVARAGVMVFGFQTAALLPLVIAFACAMHRVEQLSDFSSAFTVFYRLSLAFFVLILLVPDRSRNLKPKILELMERAQLELFLILLESARQADAIAGERIRTALALWLPADRTVISLLLPDRRSVRMLSPLLAFIRLVRETGVVDTIDHMRRHIEAALNGILADDAVSIAPGEPPSLFYSTHAAAIVDETGLTDRFPFDRMIDRIGSMLTEQLSWESVNVVADVLAAARLLQAHGRTIPDSAAISRFVRRSTLLSKPVRHQSLVELCELADLIGDAQEKERLAPIIRSRLWETLQLNPRKEVLALLDCYLAAVRIGERDSPLVSAAAVVIAEIAARTAQELTAIRPRAA
jgi:hypothetical protein